MGKVKTDDRNGTGYEWEYAKKVDNRSRGQKVMSFIYNSETHAILGRTIKSWGALLLFYSIFYSALALLFGICMKVLLLSLNTDSPKFQQSESIIGTNPGLGYRPQPEDVEAAIIWYNMSEPSNIKKWTESLDQFFEIYKNNSKKKHNCELTRKPPTTDSDYACDVDLADFKECSPQYEYGYPQGKPCVFLKLNKIYGWIPEYYNDTRDLPNGVPDLLASSINKASTIEERNKVWITCGGQSTHDTENIGPLKYYPYAGLASYYYPYLHTPNYLSPLVALQFLAPKKNVLINVECKAWAKNIVHKTTSQIREGSVHFELQVDDINDKGE